MKILAIDTYNDFECIGGKCPLTCCAYWTINIDDKTYDYYRDLPGEFGDRLRSNIVYKDGKASFVMNSEGKCPFLDENLLCDIYKEISEDNMCGTCKIYPRNTKVYGDILFANMMISCPHAAKLLLGHEGKINFVFNDQEDLPAVDSNKDVDWELFNTSIKAFTTAADVLQNRDLSICERLGVFLHLSQLMQEIVDGNIGTDEVSFDIYRNNEALAAILFDFFYQVPSDLTKVLLYVSKIINRKDELDNTNLIDEKIKLYKLYCVRHENEFNNTIMSAIPKVMGQQFQIWYEHFCINKLFISFMEGAKHKKFYDCAVKMVSELILWIVINAVEYDGTQKIENLDYQSMTVCRLSRTFEHAPKDKSLKLEKGILDEMGISNCIDLIGLLRF